MRTLTFDIETCSVDLLYTLPPEEMFRLGGYAWNNGPVVITEDLEEMRRVILEADLVVGHNIHDFDLRVVFGIKSNVPMQLADEGRVYCTWTHAVLVNPAPYKYVNRFGKQEKADKPEKLKKWFKLDEQAHQLGVKGKTDDLAKLAFEFGPEDLPKKERERQGYGMIPLDNKRYRFYLMGDVESSRDVGKALLKLGPLDEYALREQRVDSRKAAISSNGWRVDIPTVSARVEELKEARALILDELADKYAFPEEGDAPWATNDGKDAIMAALRDAGITPESRPDWEKTPGYAKLGEAQETAVEYAEIAKEIAVYLTYEPNMKAREIKKWRRLHDDAVNRSIVPSWFGLKLSGDELIRLTKGTKAEDLGQALAEVKGMRSLAELTLDCVQPDSFVHPEITMLQRSGRWSTTRPGLTVWNSRDDEKTIEKSYFIPDNDDHVLLEIDYSNADARGVAALSADTAYAERFKPGADGHLINAWAAWGREVVGIDKKNPVTAEYRQKAKPLGHGWSYGGQAKTLSEHSGVPLEDAKKFVEGMNKTFHKITSWQNRQRKFANTHGYVQNPWGRKMYVEKDRIFTQAPALMGQSFTREVVCDALLAMSHQAVRSVKAQIHDALVFSVPRRGWERYRDYLVRCMEGTYHPKGGMKMEMPVEAGSPGRNWQEAAH